MQATICQTHQAFTAAGPGAVLPAWLGDPADGVIGTLLVKCPRCGAVFGLPLRADQTPSPSKTWEITQGWPVVTLRPAVRHAACGWAGYLAAGLWITI